MKISKTSKIMCVNSEQVRTIVEQAIKHKDNANSEMLSEVRRDVKDILIQTTKTNGRVTRSESDIKELKSAVGEVQGHNIESCPHTKSIKELQDFSLAHETKRKFVLTILGLAISIGTLIGMVFGAGMYLLAK